MSTKVSRQSGSRYVRWGFAWLAASVVLAGMTYVAEYASLPAALDGVVRLLYRPVYMVMAPFHYLCRLIEFPDNRHWPWWQIPAVSLVVPPLLAVVFVRVSRSIAHVGSLFLRWRGADAEMDAGRRQFLVRATGGAVTVAGVGTLTHASVLVPERLRIVRYAAPIKNLPVPLEGLRIVHVSDTHFGPFVSLRYLERVVAKVNALQPDFIALTGDYTHRTPETIAPGIGVLAGLKPRLGLAAVLGNHDHWEGARACWERLEALGIPAVDNKRLFLSPRGLAENATEASLCIAGLGDLWEDKVAFDRALDGVPGEMPRIVLTHNPDMAEVDANGRRMDLMLSGHTHGGQIAIPGHGPIRIPSGYGLKYAGGWVQGPQCPVVVSRGVGMTVLPVRFGVPPEVGVITLKRA